MQLNQISHIDNTNCNICLVSNTCIHETRNKFIKRCLPFNNFDETKRNIGVGVFYIFKYFYITYI